MPRSLRASGACLLAAEITFLGGWLLDEWTDRARVERTLSELRGEAVTPAAEFELLANRVGEFGWVGFPVLVLLAFLFVPADRRGALAALAKRAVVLVACVLTCLQAVGRIGLGAVGLIAGYTLAFLTLLALPQLLALESRRQDRHGTYVAWQLASLALPLPLCIAIFTELQPAPWLIGYASFRWGVLAWMTLGDSKRTAAEFAGRSAAPGS